MNVKKALACDVPNHPFHPAYVEWSSQLIYTCYTKENMLLFCNLLCYTLSENSATAISLTRKK